MSSAISIFCDGLCEPTNPGGWACWAWLARSPGGKVLQERYGCLGHGSGLTGNRAEYQAVIEALRYTVTRLDLLAERGLGVVVHSDRQLVINQITGAYRVNQAHLAGLRQQVVELEDQIITFGIPVSFVWIPREQNADADALTREAYQEARQGGPPLAPGEYAIPAGEAPQTCGSCGAAIVWTRTTTGRAVPLSLALVEERGGLRVTKTHFVDCPESRQWKRS